MLYSSSLCFAINLFQFSLVLLIFIVIKGKKTKSIFGKKYVLLKKKLPVKIVIVTKNEGEN